MQALIIQNDNTILNLQTLLLEAYFNMDVDHAPVVSCAIGFINDGAVYDIILCGETEPNTITPLLDFLNEKNIKVPILFTPALEDLTKVKANLNYDYIMSYIGYDQSEDIISNRIQSLLKIKNRYDKMNEDYCRVQLQFFLLSEKAACDIYVKLSDEKFLKIFRKGTALNPKDILKYENRNCRYLYLKQSDYLKFADELINRLQDEISNRELSSEKATALSLYAHENVHEIINTLGLKKEVVDLTNFTLNTITNVSKKDKNIMVLLDSLVQQQNYICEHSIMISYLSCAISHAIGWYSDATQFKLSMAALFHDIKVKNDELAQLDCLECKEADNFSTRQLNEYKLHGVQSAEILTNFADLPPDVDKIILQHHEKPDGSGFPRGIDYKKIFSLASIFIVAEDFVNCIYNSGSDFFNISDIIRDLETRHNKGNFKLAFDGLKQSLFNSPEQIEKPKLRKLE